RDIRGFYPSPTRRSSDLELDQTAEPGRPLGEALMAHRAVAGEGQPDVALFRVHGLGARELREEPGRITPVFGRHGEERPGADVLDRKSTRLNSSHVKISY